LIFKVQVKNVGFLTVIQPHVSLGQLYEVGDSLEEMRHAVFL
jgi:hypothetical protein